MLIRLEIHRSIKLFIRFRGGDSYSGYHTRAFKGVFSSVQTCGLVEVNRPLSWFSRVGQEKIFSPFLIHSEENVGV